MRGVVSQGHWKRTALRYRNKPLCACLFQCALCPESRRDKGLHPLIPVLSQRLKAFVALSQSECLLTCGGANLHGWRYAVLNQTLGKLLVRHESLTVGTGLGNQGFFLALYLDQVLLQNWQVELEGGLSEHPQGQVNQFEFLLVEVLAENVEQVVGQLDIVFAVLTILSKVCLGEVGTALTYRRNNLSAFLTQVVALGGFRQTVAHLCAVNGAEHG